MSTKTRAPRSRSKHQADKPVAQERRPRAANTKPVLVSTDGSPAAGAAIKVAALMANRGDWEPQVLTVFEPMPVSVADVTIGAPAAELQQATTDSAFLRIRRQLRQPGTSEWPIDVRFGRVPHTIAEAARESGCELIVLGLGKHGRLARLFGAETAARVIRRSDVPVLAVADGARHLPYTAVVAMDFGESSVRAAREALALLERPGRLHLVHVRWAMNGNVARDEAWERTYALGVEHGFQRLVKELRPRPGIRVTYEMRLGGVIETVLKVADEAAADLIAVGSHSQTTLDRLLIGSTPSLLLRAAPVSVLVTPPERTDG